MPIPHEDLYARLRWGTLSRHYSLGRWWRNNYFTCGTVLGERAAPATTTVFDCDAAWAPPVRNGTPLYTDATQLIGNNALANERWRVMRRNHVNSLLMTGVRLISLCVDHRLGRADARPIVKLTLDTLASLYKFPADTPFGGYILRWDPATTDTWTVKTDPKGVEAPQVCCEFLVNADGKRFAQSHYLYCSPFDDPRYMRAKAAGGKDRFRAWEPSMDEYVGLVAGLFIVFHTFKSDTSTEGTAIQTEVKRQAKLVGRYLQKVGYLLVRPCGGFTARGAAGPNPCYEYAFSRVFKRITGDAFAVPSSATFDDAVAQAGLTAGMHRRTVTSAALALNALTTSPVWGDVRNLLGNDPVQRLGTLTTDASGTLMRAAQALLNLDCLDISADEDRSEFVVGQIMKSICLSSPQKGFEVFMGSPAVSGNWSDFHKVLIGLTALDDDDSNHVVRDCYLKWYDAVVFPRWNAPNQDEVLGTEAWCIPTLATAVAALLREDDPIKRALHDDRLAKDLGRMRDTLETKFASDNPLISPDAETHDKVGYWFGYMAPLSAAWLHQVRMGANTVQGVPRPTATSVQNWKAPSVPAEAIKAAHVDRLPIPLNAVHQGPVPAQNAGEVPLLADAVLVPKPADNSLGAMPAPQMGTPTTLSVSALPVFGPAHKAFSLPLPPLALNGWQASDYQCVSVKANTQEMNSSIISDGVRGNAYVIDVKLETSLIPLQTASYRAEVTLAWVIKQV